MGISLNDTKTEENEDCFEGLNLLFPYSCTIELTSQKTKTLIHSGKLSFPVKDPLLVLNEENSSGKIFVCGSYKFFTDEYLKKEDNEKLVSILFEKADAFGNVKQTEIQIKPTPKIVPSIEKLSENLKAAIQTNPDLSGNVFNLFENNLFKVHFNLQKETIQLHEKLKVERKPLTLISPVYETPMLGLTPSVFPPILVDMDTPNLELYDLDDEFANLK